jgi:hypothetical protein
MYTVDAIEPQPLRVPLAVFVEVIEERRRPLSREAARFSRLGSFAKAQA